MRIILIIFLCITSFLAGVGATYYATNKETGVDTANLLLHELSKNVKLANLVNDSGNNVDVEKIKMLQNKNIAESIVAISVFQPEVSELDSISLETLCEMIQLSNNGIFENPNIGGIGILAKEYLKNISGSVSKQVSELQKTFRGTGCKISI
jgi:hypothetical protein